MHSIVLVDYFSSFLASTSKVVFSFFDRIDSIIYDNEGETPVDIVISKSRCVANILSVMKRRSIHLSWEMI